MIDQGEHRRPAYETLAIEREGDHILIVTLNRPEVLNALNTQMGLDLLDLWTFLTDSPETARIVVLTGAGERAFCAGGDLKERDGMTDRELRAQHEIFERAFIALFNCPVPIIAALNGHAFGGGLEMALGCDFIYAAQDARLALSEVKLGIMPGAGGTQTLARAAGERRAKELVMTGRAFTADEAYAWGICNRVCARDTLRDEALETATAIAGKAPLSIRQAKKSIHYGLHMDLENGYRFEIETYNRLITTGDRLEGIRAFNDKRKPEFRGG